MFTTGNVVFGFFAVTGHNRYLPLEVSLGDLESGIMSTYLTDMITDFLNSFHGKSVSPQL